MKDGWVKRIIYNEKLREKERETERKYKGKNAKAQTMEE